MSLVTCMDWQPWWHNSLYSDSQYDQFEFCKEYCKVNILSNNLLYVQTRNKAKCGEKLYFNLSLDIRPHPELCSLAKFHFALRGRRNDVSFKSRSSLASVTCNCMQMPFSFAFSPPRLPLLTTPLSLILIRLPVIILRYKVCPCQKLCLCYFATFAYFRLCDFSCSSFEFAYVPASVCSWHTLTLIEIACQSC